MPNTIARLAVIGAACLAVVALDATPSAAQRGAANGQWASYGGDDGSTKYAPLDQIDAGNIDQLVVAWQWVSADNAVMAENREIRAGGFKGTPVMVDGVLYIRTSLSIVAAIDASTGEQLWVRDVGSYEAGRPTNLGFNTRGVAHWSDGVESRIFLATGDSHLWSFDAATGQPIGRFGGDGKIDLTQGLLREAPRGDYQVMSPPMVVGDVVIVGSSIADGPQNMTAPPGDIRGFDTRTGELRWTFHTVPQAGEFGSDTWEDNSWRYTGNTNVWTVMSADQELGYVYLPIGTPTNDWYGGHRVGDNLFAESLVCLDAATGERVWHFQMVHHGLWDYDLPAAPTLVDITVDGRDIKAVAQVSKQGFTYVFDRVTGEPVWPIEERSVAQSSVPGERTSPTQPFPSKPPAFERQGMSVDALIDFTPELRAEAEQILSEFEYGDLFHPPSEQGTIQMPGWGGGANWYGAGFDPDTDYLYVPSSTNPISVRLEKPDPGQSDFTYRRGRSGLRGPRGLPLVKPPYSRLTAIDLSTGEQAWQVPLGDGPRQQVIDLGAPDPGPLGGNGYTGPVVTKTLLFLGVRGNERTGQAPVLNAYDKATGDIVHALELPEAPSGTPMTYMANGRQFVVAAYSRGTDAGLLALALP
ncbi:MAG: pyrroloquinoline quinone-dependent dehydrogenase [Acidobacteria bacterium]|nr:pyrroloquinoline quinone-dependent dehydrogenase [Acidobacteriota bacterium]